MGGYGQFCPVAKAMELLDERWTMLVVRELLHGSRHFNTLRRGVPACRRRCCPRGCGRWPAPRSNATRTATGRYVLTPAARSCARSSRLSGSGAPAGCPSSGTRTWTRTC